VGGKRGPSVESLREGFEIQQGLKVRAGNKQSVIGGPLSRLAPVDQRQGRSQTGWGKAYSRFG